MKFLMTALTLGLSLSAQAGSLNVTCKNADNSLMFDRSSLVALVKSGNSPQRIEILTNTTGDTPAQGDSIEFANGLSGGGAKLSVVSLTDRKTIEDNDGGACPGGHGPGSIIESYKISGFFSLNGGKVQRVQLTCVEEAGWSGNCAFEE